MSLVKNGGKITHEEFITLFPHIAPKAEVWDKVLDNDGKIRFNLDFYNQYNNASKARALQAKNQRSAAKGKKLKF